VPLCNSVLVIEDDKDIRESILEALGCEGYNVDEASNGLEGLARLKEKTQPTLVLLDLMMPVMSGWEFLDAQKADPALAHHRVITISALKPQQSLQDSTPLDTAGGICKPFSLESLWEEVRKNCVTPSVTA
jgi:two-component system response regulator CpxR